MFLFVDKELYQKTILSVSLSPPLSLSFFFVSNIKHLIFVRRNETTRYMLLIYLFFMSYIWLLHYTHIQFDSSKFFYHMFKSFRYYKNILSLSQILSLSVFLYLSSKFVGKFRKTWILSCDTFAMEVLEKFRCKSSV